MHSTKISFCIQHAFNYHVKDSSRLTNPIGELQPIGLLVQCQSTFAELVQRRLQPIGASIVFLLATVGYRKQI